MKPRIPPHDEVELLEKELFRSFERDEPSARARHVAAAGLGLGTAALTTALGAEGAAMKSVAPKAAGLLIAKWVGVGTVAGAMSLGAVHYARPHLTSHLPKATVIATARDPIPSQARSHEVAAPIAPPEQAPPVAPPAMTAAPTGVRVQPAAPALPTRTTTPAARVSAAAETPNEERATEIPATAAPRATPSMLAAEVHVLDEARGALAASDGARALDALRSYARQFPAGTLNLEATVLRIEALYMTGSASAATALAQDFLAAHPTSTHAARVRRLLAEHAKP